MTTQNRKTQVNVGQLLVERDRQTDRQKSIRVIEGRQKRDKNNQNLTTLTKNK